MKSDKSNKKIWRRLTSRYRLVLLNDETFEEHVSFKMTPLSFIIIISATTIVMTSLIIGMIAFTSLKEYIPGYADVNMRRDLLSMAVRTDSMEKAIEDRNTYINNVQNILNGKVGADTISAIPKDTGKDYTKIKMSASEREEKMRQQMENQSLYSLNVDESKGTGALSEVFFFTPIKGAITNSFNLKIEHLGIDIAAPENEIVKNILDGTVVLSEYTTESGYVIYIQHSNNILSVYKHNSKLLVKLGDYVRSGAPLAIVGNTGETSVGTHLHFELWHDGHAVNPQDYIIF